MILEYHGKRVRVGCVYFGYKMSLHNLIYSEMEWRKPQRANIVFDRKCGSCLACGDLLKQIGFQRNCVQLFEKMKIHLVRYLTHAVFRVCIKQLCLHC